MYRVLSSLINIYRLLSKCITIYEFTYVCTYDTGKDSNEPIRVVTFNTNGSYLALGSEDGNIYLYDPKEKFVLSRSIQAHKAPLASIDFSTDGNYLMSVDATKRIRFTEALTGLSLNSPVSIRDEKWSSWTSNVGWPAKGLWMIQTADSEPTSTCRSANSSLLASGNSAGRLYVTHNPCSSHPRFLSVAAHAGSVSRIGWGAGDSRIFTLGEKDHVVMQWKVQYDDARESGEEGGHSCDDSELDQDGGGGYADRPIARKKAGGNYDEEELTMINTNVGGKKVTSMGGSGSAVTGGLSQQVIDKILILLILLIYSVFK